MFTDVLQRHMPRHEDGTQRARDHEHRGMRDVAPPGQPLGMPGEAEMCLAKRFFGDGRRHQGLGFPRLHKEKAAP